MAQERADALLKEYRERRDFSKTREPGEKSGGGKRGARQGLSFVVQKHDASRLHYDFRLEWNGVLKSWAVTKGPSYDPSEKRLAVRTEDHPLTYGGFEGTIPKDQYGGGTVMIWDRGTWEPVEDFETGLKEGKLVFRLEGDRLKGEWTLVRMKSKRGEKRENWLLIKHREEGFRQPRGDVLNKHTRSLASGRTMNQIARSGDEWRSESDASNGRARANSRGRGARAAKAGRAMPRWRAPLLATLVEVAPEGKEWLSELKYDGYRALIGIAGGKARVFTRNGKDWTEKFPAIAEAAARLETDGTLLDGEIVAFSKGGRTDFSALQAAIKDGGELSCFVFDLLEHDGEHIAERPLSERKERLRELLGEGSAPLVYSTHVGGNAAGVLEEVCAAGHEGIVAKRADAPYRSGRGRSWLKVKCSKRQELVIGGWSPSDKKERPFSSILLGVNDGGKFVYKGRVGSGFDEDILDELAAKFGERARKTSPFDEVPRSVARNARFVTPDLVAEIEFTEFTVDGMVRHGVFKGLREDKDADDIVLETAQEAEMATEEKRDTFAGVHLSHPDKVVFAEQGVTKADLAAHYERVAERMLPLVENRLVSLVRCPDGPDGQCFFQRHGHKGFPDALKTKEITEKDGKKDEYLYIETLASLIAGVQMGTLEFHIWGSRIDRLEGPDRLVFDLDPDESLGFAGVRDAAFEMRNVLADIGLKTVPLVTGGKGIHVIAPLERRAEWPGVKQFARGVATTMAGDNPNRYLAQASKEKRKGRIFIDWLRNERGASAIAPFSTRARKGAPVATPVSWGELSELRAANCFHIEDMAERLKQADPWAESTGWRQSITKAMLAQVAE